MKQNINYQQKGPEFRSRSWLTSVRNFYYSPPPSSYLLNRVCIFYCKLILENFPTAFSNCLFSFFSTQTLCFIFQNVLRQWIVYPGPLFLLTLYILSALSHYFKCHRLFNLKQFSLLRRRRRSEILMITFS